MGVRGLCLLAGISLFFTGNSANAQRSALSCLLYIGGSETPLNSSGPGEMKAASRGVTVTIYSMGDNSFDAFQAVLEVPRLKDIRSYGTKSGLKAVSGSVVGYLNNSRNDEIAVTCEAK